MVKLQYKQLENRKKQKSMERKDSEERKESMARKEMMERRLTLNFMIQTMMQRMEMMTFFRQMFTRMWRTIIRS
jgi:hypothetical protein